MAEHPLALPWHIADRQRLGQAMLQTIRDLRRSNALEWAAVLSFYALASAFPLLLVAMIAASWAVDPAWSTRKATALLGAYLPYAEVEIEEIVQRAVAARHRAGLLSLLVVLVSGRRVLGALTKALNLVSDVDERTDPLKRRIAVEVALVVGLGGGVERGLASGRTRGAGTPHDGVEAVRNRTTRRAAHRSRSRQPCPPRMRLPTPARQAEPGTATVALLV